MADKKAEITALNLQGSINLNSMKSEIMPYESGSFNAKNSLFYGNKLTNWHKNFMGNDVYRQYKGYPVKVDGSLVTYKDKTYQIEGSKVTLEEIEYTEKKPDAYVLNGSVYVGEIAIDNIPYNGYASVTKVSNNLWVVSVIPYTCISLRDCVTYRVTVTVNGNTVIVGGHEKYQGAIVHGETGYGAYVEYPKAVYAKVKIGYVNKGVSTFAELWNGLTEVTVPMNKGSHALNAHEVAESDNYVGDFTILANKQYIQCTFDSGSPLSSNTYAYARYTGFFGNGFKWFNIEQAPSLFGKLNTYYDGYRRDIMLTQNGTKSYWAGGVKVALEADDMRTFDVLYNWGGIIEGISWNNSILARDVDEILETGVDITQSTGVINGYYLIYKYNNKYYKLTRGGTSLGKKYFMVKNYLCYVTDAYLNTIDLDTGKVFCRSDDYNNRVFPTCHAPDSTAQTTNYNGNTLYSKDDYYSLAYQYEVAASVASNNQVANKVELASILYASGVNEMYYADNIPNPATIEAPISVWGSFAEDSFEKNIARCGVYSPYGDEAVRNIDIFIPNMYGGAPLYYTTLGSYLKSGSLDAGVTAYPMETGNTLYTLTALDEIKDTYLNQMIVKSENYSTFTVMDNKLNPVLAYYLLTMVEFDSVFIMQGTYYASSGDYIIRLQIDGGLLTGTSVVASKKDMIFIGSTTREAYFYSLFDKSIYTFTGDFNLSKSIEVTSIDEVYEAYNNPAVGLIAVSTNKGLVVMYQNQICLIEDSTDKEIYYDDKCIINGKNRFCLESKDNFVKLPVVIETELYGSGGEIKSVNDCVYIRLYTDKLDQGEVKITSRTLNEISKNAEAKTIKITKGSWDSESGTMYIRYQPRNQAATGFSVRIESDFPVASVSISHKPETVQSASYNL